MTDAERAEIYKAAFRWWRKWPEYVPNPDHHDDVMRDVQRARELFDAEAPNMTISRPSRDMEK